MPYDIKKQNNKYAIVNKDKVVGQSDSKQMALKAIQARYANEKGK
jgi:hypothetical protein